jgi:hypothetical protein
MTMTSVVHAVIHLWFYGEIIFRILLVPFVFPSLYALDLREFGPVRSGHCSIFLFSLIFYRHSQIFWEFLFPAHAQRHRFSFSICPSGSRAECYVQLRTLLVSVSAYLLVGHSRRCWFHAEWDPLNFTTVAIVPWIWSPLSRPIKILWLRSNECYSTVNLLLQLLQYSEQCFLKILQYTVFG